MNKLLPIFVVAFVFLVTGLGCGMWLGLQVKSGEPGVTSLLTKIPGVSSLVKSDENSPIELYEYPIIKWRAKPLADVPEAIIQLWTTYEPSDPPGQQGKMNYKLTVFKAPEKGQFEVQLLDKTGFKLLQFDASDFHQIPGSADLKEARDSYSCTEDLYKKIRDYSIK